MEEEKKRVLNWRISFGQRNSKILIADGYKYHYDKNGYYRCGHSHTIIDENGIKRVKKCRVRIKEIINKGDIFFVYSVGSIWEHGHDNKYFNNEIVKKSIDKVMEDKDNLEFNNMYILTEAFNEQWGIKAKNVYTEICKKNKMQKEQKLSGLKEQIQKFTLFENNEIVILADEEIYPKILSCSRIYCDGTFDAVPKGMYQLYTILGVVDDIVYPFFYCLMKNKKADTYIKLFSIINSKLKNKLCENEIEIMGDYEIMNLNLEYLKKKYCYFHYCKLIYKRKSKRTSEELVQDLVQLPLLPIEQAENFYPLIKEKYGTPGNGNYSTMNQKLLNYYDKQYINNDKMPMETWNVSVDENKTNNICETYHRSLNSFLNVGKPDYDIYVYKLFKYNEMRKKMIQKGIDIEFSKRGIRNELKELERERRKNEVIEKYIKILKQKENQRKRRFPIFTNKIRIIRKENVREFGSKPFTQRERELVGNLRIPIIINQS